MIQSDTYNATGCYNLQCPGFIQISGSIVLGGAISPVSAFEGNQYEITVSMWKVCLFILLDAFYTFQIIRYMHR